MSNGLTPSARTRHSDHALAAYLAPLFQGRRVAVIGPTSGELARRCRALGAATTVSFGGQGDGIAVRPLTPGSLRGFRGRLDVVIVPEAGLVPMRGVLEEARHALGQDGVLAVASVGAIDRKLEAGVRERGPDYNTLYDALSRDFGVVRMVGRGSFVGYTLAALDGGDGAEGEDGEDGGVALDTRLMPDDVDPAEGFIAVAADKPFPLDGLAIVQVPASEVLSASENAAPPREMRDPGLVDERDRARAELSRTAVELTTAQAALAGAEALRDELRGELSAREVRVRELEANAAERWVQLQRLEHQYKELDEDARKARDRAVRLAKDLEDERKLRQRVELETQMQNNRRSADLSPRTSDGAELARSRERVEQLERELTAFRSKVDGLVRELDETQATEGELRGQVDEAEKRAKAAEEHRERAETHAKAASERTRAAEERAQASAAAAAKSAEQARAAVEAKPVASEPTAVKQPAHESEELLRLQGEYQGLERALRERGAEVTTLRAQLADRDAAVRELAFVLEVAERSEAAVERQKLRDQAASVAGVNASLTAEARALLEQNARLRDELARAAVELERATERERAAVVSAQVALQAAPEGALSNEQLDEALHESQAARAAAEFALERAKRELDELRAAAVARGAEASASEVEALRAAAAEAARERDRVRAAGAELEREATAAREREASAVAKLAEGESAAAQVLARERARAERAEAERAEAVRAAERKSAAVDPAELERAVAAEREKTTQAVALERIRVAELTKQLGEARTELSRQFALSASTEDRVQQTMLELEGTRAGYKRRVRELEREVESLVQALEIATTESKDEVESLDRFMRDIETLRAEKTGVEYRLRDAEAALEAVAARGVAPSATRGEGLPATSAGPTSDELLGASASLASGLSPEVLLADLAETAARLAATEEALAQARDLATESEARAELARRELDMARVEASRGPSPGQLESLEVLRRESAEREVLARSLVAQLEDRDLRLRSMERRLVEEVERARRTESEIWEVELRTRDQRIAQLAREADRAARGDEARGDTGAGLRAELEAARANLSGRDSEVQKLRASIDVVRSGLSSILVDGRGAVVAHDLVTILRQIDDGSSS